METRQTPPDTTGDPEHIALGREQVPIRDGQAILRTKSATIRIDGDRVHKTYARDADLKYRAARDVAALERLRGLDGFPHLLERNAGGSEFVMTRLDGTLLTDCPDPPDHFFEHLRELVDAMLARGVARHSLPARDVLVRPDGRAGIVDFERVTLRQWRLGPVWHVARHVTRFHLIRLIGDHAPHLLNPRETRSLQRRLVLADFYRHHWRRWRR